MPFGPVGGVFLSGVQFSTDPSPYEPANWVKRHSVHMAIGGKTTIQDFGLFMKDNTLKLGSGGERFLSEPTVLSLHTLYRTRGVAFAFTDWLGNAFTVFIKAFVPVPYRRGGDPFSGTQISLYTYTMDLHVLTITTLLGVTYTGT